MVSYDSWPYPIGYFIDIQVPRFDMIIPVGSCCDAILAAHLSQVLGAFFVLIYRASQSTR